MLFTEQLFPLFMLEPSFLHSTPTSMFPWRIQIYWCFSKYIFKSQQQNKQQKLILWLYIIILFIGYRIVLFTCISQEIEEILYSSLLKGHMCLLSFRFLKGSQWRNSSNIFPFEWLTNYEKIHQKVMLSRQVILSSRDL